MLKSPISDGDPLETGVEAPVEAAGDIIYVKTHDISEEPVNDTIDRWGVPRAEMYRIEPGVGTAVAGQRPAAQSQQEPTVSSPRQRVVAPAALGNTPQPDMGLGPGPGDGESFDPGPPPEAGSGGVIGPGPGESVPGVPIEAPVAIPIDPNDPGPEAIEADSAGVPPESS